MYRHLILANLPFCKFLSKCDTIAFMKHGTIAEIGTHEQLVTSEKDYVRMTSLDITQKKFGEKKRAEKALKVISD